MLFMKPAISVIVPVFNLEPYLRKCLDSILSQTFTDFEVIVVNDGSTDQSGIIAEMYAQQDQRIRVIHQLYQGVSAARNAGIDAARGQYIGFVDGDDYIDKAMYEILYELCRETRSDIGVCKLGREIDGRLINENETNTVVKEMDNTTAMRELFTGNLYRFSLCNKLFKKTCFRSAVFPNGRIHEDLATTYRLFAQSERTVFTNYTGYIYVKRQQSILTAAFHEQRLDAFTAWDEITAYMDQYYLQLHQEVYASFGYWSVDNIHYILNQVEDQKEKEKYLKTIQIKTAKHYKNLMKNKSLSFKYKQTLTLLRYNIYLLLLTIRLKRKVLPV